MTTLRNLLGACALLISAGAAAHGQPPALAISPDAQGQLLIFPYYTTAAGNSTLLTLSNDAPVPKVLRVRIAEGENGQDVLSFHLYLAANDSWTGALFDRGETQTPGLLSEDLSCTLPSLNSGADLPQLPDGRRYTPLRGGLDDGGSTTPARLREGFIEVLEVAGIDAATATATAVAAPRNCAALRAAWAAPDGYWHKDPFKDLSNPGGRISGEAAIVNVAAGTVFGLAPVAIDNFRVAAGSQAKVVVHELLTGRTAPLSTLALTLPDAGTVVAAVYLPSNTRRCHLTYPAPARAADALSAVLAAEYVRAPYEEDPAIGARTSYLLTYPTRPLYTDPRYTNAATALPPFLENFQGLLPRNMDSGIYFRSWDREAADTLWGGPPECPFDLCIPREHIWLPGTAVEVFTPGAAPDPALGTRLSGHVLDAGNQVLPLQGNGTLELELSFQGDGRGGRGLRPSLEGVQVRGLPLIATRLISYVNADAAPGILANYTTAFPVQRGVDLRPYDCVE